MPLAFLFEINPQQTNIFVEQTDWISVVTLVKLVKSFIYCYCYCYCIQYININMSIYSIYLYCIYIYIPINFWLYIKICSRYTMNIYIDINIHCVFQEKQPVTKRKVVINMMDKYAKPVLKQVTAFIRNDGGPLLVVWPPGLSY